jgi:hypothetical protein
VTYRQLWAQRGEESNRIPECSKCKEFLLEIHDHSLAVIDCLVEEEQ